MIYTKTTKRIIRVSPRAKPNQLIITVHPDHIHDYYMEIDHVEHGIGDHDDWPYDEGPDQFRPVVYTPWDHHGMKVSLQALLEE